MDAAQAAAGWWFHPQTGLPLTETGTAGSSTEREPPELWLEVAAAKPAVEGTNHQPTESPFTDTAETSILPAIRPETGTPTSSSPWEPPGLRQEERAASFTPPQALELRWPIRIARESP